MVGACVLKEGPGSSDPSTTHPACLLIEPPFRQGAGGGGEVGRERGAERRLERELELQGSRPSSAIGGHRCSMP